jgi:hypothetical protein
MFIRLYKCPYVWFYLTLSTYVANKNSLTTQTLMDIYMVNSIWSFYKKPFIKNKGILLNNLHKSYEYWFVKTNVNLIDKEEFRIKLHSLSANKTDTSYFKNIKIINWSFKKYRLNQLIIIMIRYLLNVWGSYTNQFIITHSFINVKDVFYFMIAYNRYYFRVYNY